MCKTFLTAPAKIYFFQSNPNPFFIKRKKSSPSKQAQRHTIRKVVKQHHISQVVVHHELSIDTPKSAYW